MTVITRQLIVFALAAWALAGVVTAHADWTRKEKRQIDELEERIETLEDTNTELTKAVRSLANHVRQMQNLIDSDTLVSVLERLDLMQNEAAELRELTEQTGYSQERMQSRLREIIIDFDRRIQDMRALIEKSRAAGLAAAPYAVGAARGPGGNAGAAGGAYPGAASEGYPVGGQGAAGAGGYGSGSAGGGTGQGAVGSVGTGQGAVGSGTGQTAGVGGTGQTAAGGGTGQGAAGGGTGQGVAGDGAGSVTVLSGSGLGSGQGAAGILGNGAVSGTGVATTASGAAAGASGNATMPGVAYPAGSLGAQGTQAGAEAEATTAQGGAGGAAGGASGLGSGVAAGGIAGQSGGVLGQGAQAGTVASGRAADANTNEIGGTGRIGGVRLGGIGPSVLPDEIIEADRIPATGSGSDVRQTISGGIAGSSTSGGDAQVAGSANGRAGATTTAAGAAGAPGGRPGAAGGLAAAPTTVTAPSSGAGSSSGATANTKPPPKPPAKRKGKGKPDPQAEANKQYGKALRMFSQRQFKSALLIFSSLYGQYPQYIQLAGDATFWAADCYYNLSQLHDSLELYRRLESKFPNHRKYDDGQLKMGYVLHSLGEFEESARVLKRLLNSDREDIVRLATARLRRVQLDMKLRQR